jgi:hypothetical protein
MVDALARTTSPRKEGRDFSLRCRSPGLHRKRDHDKLTVETIIGLLLPARLNASYNKGHFMNDEPRARRGWNWWYLLFVIQFVAVLWPPFYNRTDPTLMGIPFFYWYQLLWVILAAALTAIVYSRSQYLR